MCPLKAAAEPSPAAPINTYSTLSQQEGCAYGWNHFPDP